MKSYISILARNPLWPLIDIENPYDNDVLCGRGGGSQNHPGNDYYRNMISSNKYRYLSSNKLGKREIALELVSIIYTMNPPGRFLEKNEWNLTYNDIGEERAVLKVSQALREGAPIIRKNIAADRTAREQATTVYPSCSLVYSGSSDSEEYYINSPEAARHHRMVASSRNTIENRSYVSPSNGLNWSVVPPSLSQMKHNPHHQPQYWNEFYHQQYYNGYHSGYPPPGNHYHHPLQSNSISVENQAHPTNYYAKHSCANQHCELIKSNLPMRSTNDIPKNIKPAYQPTPDSYDPKRNFPRNVFEDKEDGNYLNSPTIQPATVLRPSSFYGTLMKESFYLDNEFSENKDDIAAEFNVPVSKSAQRKYWKSYSFEEPAENEDCKCKSTAVTCCTIATDKSSSLKQHCDDKEIDAANLMMHFRDERSELVLTDISDGQQSPKASLATLTTEVTSSANSTILEQTTSQIQTTDYNRAFESIKTYDTALMSRFNDERDIILSSSTLERQEMSNRSIGTFAVDDIVSVTGLDESNDMERFYNNTPSLLIAPKDVVNDSGGSLMNRRDFFGKEKSGNSMQISFSSIMSSNRSVMSS